MRKLTVITNFTESQTYRIREPNDATYYDFPLYNDKHPIFGVTKKQSKHVKIYVKWEEGAWNCLFFNQFPSYKFYL